ncbi:MAG: glucose-1-phosphate adenylyltransferase [Armatimonadota bacterium]|nr:glucose-1-phosphate adenylyltransferase [Armatimonadota bacterium]MDR7518304.1 glucose-1-phosphate adenylyltransferase [Armatimonadota bacterium]MDR7549952.1 glucose-1-phosphate adenylyltransferase [Armatimonadota bacterium]
MSLRAAPTRLRSGRQRLLGFVLAGGRGERLQPLTRERGKPAVPFGGKYRIIDFVLSNFVNSGIHAIYALVQYKAQSLIEHLRVGWRFGGLPDHFVIAVPPQMRWGETWYRGTADAIYQNLNLLRDFNPDIVLIFGADHIYRMDLDQMLAFHLERDAQVTVAALPVPIEQASEFGIIEADADGRIVGFEEKPDAPKAMRSDPTRALSSMGNYIFNRDILVETLIEDARRSTDHDFGRTIIPELYPYAGVFAYNFLANEVPGTKAYEEPGYWRDVGTLAAYWQAHMDLLGPTPPFDLDNPQWPILTAPYAGPAAHIIGGEITDSLIGEGCRVRDAAIRRSILGRGVKVGPGAVIEESVVMDHTIVGRGARLRRVIADRFNVIPDGDAIGVDAARDAQRYTVDPSGIVVLPRGLTRYAP